MSSSSRRKRLVGRCPALFLLAVCFDLLGFSLILAGVFAELRLDGRIFGEFLIYGGGILLFFSLLWWLGWYSFNLEVSMEELLLESPPSPNRTNLLQLARKLSERLSQRAKRRLGKDGSPQAGPVPLTPFVFVSNGPHNTPTLGQKQLELRTVSSLCEVAGVQGMVDRLI